MYQTHHDTLTVRVLGTRGRGREQNSRLAELPGGDVGGAGPYPSKPIRARPLSLPVIGGG
jgi:hypothetical protein